MVTQVAKTIIPGGGGDYVSLYAAVADNFGIGGNNLVTADVYVTLTCSSGLDVGGTPNFYGITTDATRNLKIIATGTDRHTNQPSTGYRLQGAAYGNCLQCCKFMTLEGLGFVDYSSYSHAMLILSNLASGGIKINNCYFDGATNADPAISVLYDALTVQLWNNTVKGKQTFVTSASAATYSVYNNTIVNCTYGISRSAGTFTIKNCLFSGCTYDIGGSGGTITDTYCTTTNDNTKGLTAAGTGNRFSQTFSWNAGPPPYDLGATDAGARTYGIADPGAGLFTDDIHGLVRGAVWDCGADQVTQPTGNSLPVFYNNCKQRWL
jgi:hypothetical protein